MKNTAVKNNDQFADEKPSNFPKVKNEDAQGNASKLENTDSSITEKILNSENGAIGYVLAWFLGVPASVLLLIFLFRG